jgi:uncharacterized protein (TIGR00251 family)
LPQGFVILSRVTEPHQQPALRITATTDAVTFPLRVTPRAKRNAVAGVMGDALKVQVTAPPEDGRANDAVIETLADWLGVKRRQVEIIAGTTSRHKIARVTGLAQESLVRRIKRW